MQARGDTSSSPQPKRTRPMWVEPLIWVLLVVALVVAALPTLFYPLTRDQGIYAYIADLMAHGGAPFRDAWEIKPPAVFFVYWLAFLLVGRTEFALRLFDVLYTLLSAAAVTGLAWQSFRDRRIAVLSGWLYTFCYYFLVHFHSMATPEAFMTPFLAASVYGMVRGVRRRQNVWFFVAGVAAGVVFWFKPTAGLPIAAVLIWTWREMRRERWNSRQAWIDSALLVGGVLLGLAPIGLYLYGRGLREFWEIWRVYGTGTYLEAGGLVRGASPFAALDVVLRYVRDWELVVWLSLAGAVGALAWRRRNRSGEALVVFWVACIVATLLQGKLFEYHWIPILAPAAILMAMCIVWLALEMRDRLSVVLCDMRNIVVLTVVLALAMWMGYDRISRFRTTFGYVTGRMSEEHYYAQYDIGQDFSALGTRLAAAYLRDHTQPQDTALIWGVEPLVNFLAQRRSPTNFISFYVLVSGQGKNPHLDAWRADFLDDIHQHPPVYIVLVDDDVTPLAPVGSRAQLKDFPAFESILSAEYEFETQVEDYSFYRRKTNTS